MAGPYYLPSARCPDPDCGSLLTDVLAPVDDTRQFGPGERAVYVCMDCEHQFVAIVPEPPDGYEGDGVFAENH